MEKHSKRPEDLYLGNYTRRLTFYLNPYTYQCYAVVCLKIVKPCCKKAAELNRDLAKGLNIVHGKIVHEGIPR